MSVGLVLEGGGMRGAYTAGVLCAFEDNHIQFPSVYGVSAGACNALSYVSGQAYRNHAIFQRYVQGQQYVSVKNFLTSGCIFNFDYLFGDLFHTTLPFDFDTFYNSKVHLSIAATDIKTGLPVYFTKRDLDERMIAVRASSSLPFLSRVIKLGGYRLLDGGIAVPIPIERSVCDGNEYHVVVFTREAHFYKTNKPDFPRRLMKAKYYRYPALLRAMDRRAQVYNDQRIFCQILEKKGKAVVVIPSKPIDISRYEKDSDTLMAVFDLGYHDALKRVDEIRAMLAEHTVQTV